jgi:hypothetical protein
VDYAGLENVCRNSGFFATKKRKANIRKEVTVGEVSSGECRSQDVPGRNFNPEIGCSFSLDRATTPAQKRVFCILAKLADLNPRNSAQYEKYH